MTNKNICSFFGKCGGCLYQDLPEKVYLDKKLSFIRRSFTDHGIILNPEPIRSVPLTSRRRASFAYARGKLGYNALKSHDIIPITECRLLKPEIVSFLPTLRGWAKNLGGKGDIFVLVTAWGLDIHIRPEHPQTTNLPLLERLALWASDERVVRLTYNNEPIVEKVHLPFLPDSFLQPSKEGEDILIALMLSAVQPSDKRALDLFCGSGTFTRPLLDKGLVATGYDCASAVSTLGSNGVQRDLFRSPLLPEEMADIDLIVMDPPRAGAKAQTEQIAQTQVPTIVMISCNPLTAARDCKVLMDAGWEIESVTPIDQFRWSNHIELVCVLKKNLP